MLSVAPIQADFFTASSMSVSPYCGPTPICENVDGAFEVVGIAPGNYWVTAQISVPLTLEQRTLLETPGADPSLLPQPQRAVAAVHVTNSDVEDVKLRFYSKLNMTGHVLIDDSTISTLPGADTIKVGLRQSYSGVLGPAQNATLDAAGTFSTGNLIPGEYRLDVRDLPSGVFMVDARLGDRDVSNDVIQILAPQSDELNIRLTSKSGNVNGVVVDSASKPVPSAVIVLVPVNESNRPDRYKTATALADGSFQIKGVAPGDYTAFSWQSLEDYAWFDPNVVQQFEAKGKSVHVAASSNEELQLTQIPSIAN